jgi:predicted nicotinamide N-methyase
MSVISRRALLCALPALPFVPRAFAEPSAVRVIIANNVGFDQRMMDQIITGIRKAVDDRDVIVFQPKRAP